VTLKGQGGDLIIFGAQYLKKGCRYGLRHNGGRIGNGVCGI